MLPSKGTATVSPCTTSDPSIAPLDKGLASANKRTIESASAAPEKLLPLSLVMRSAMVAG